MANNSKVDGHTDVMVEMTITEKQLGLVG